MVLSAKSLKTLKLGCLNVCGCNDESKKRMIGDIMRESDLDIMALNETKLKGVCEKEIGEVKAIWSGVSYIYCVS
jgi:hypothetical protein